MRPVRADDAEGVALAAQCVACGWRHEKTPPTDLPALTLPAPDREGPLYRMALAFRYDPDQGAYVLPETVRTVFEGGLGDPVPPGDQPFASAGFCDAPPWTWLSTTGPRGAWSERGQNILLTVECLGSEHVYRLPVDRCHATARGDLLAPSRPVGADAVSPRFFFNAMQGARASLVSQHGKHAVSLGHAASGPGFSVVWMPHQDIVVESSEVPNRPNRLRIEVDSIAVQDADRAACRGTCVVMRIEVRVRCAHGSLTGSEFTFASAHDQTDYLRVKALRQRPGFVTTAPGKSLEMFTLPAD